MYYSQFGEDKILLDLLGQKSRGTCVEVGANDGVHGSTTLFFEKRGWNCVLVEPNPALCDELRRQRSAQVFECAASSQAGTATLQIAEGAALAHAVSTICEGDQAHRILRSHGVVTKPTLVEMRRLDDILEESRISLLDFISIDVEGHELEVLKGFSLDRWNPTIVIIEDNSLFKDSRAKSHLRHLGYVPFLRTGVNDWYARKENKTLISRNYRRDYFISMIQSRALMLKVRLKAKIKRIPGASKLHRIIKS